MKSKLKINVFLAGVFLAGSAAVNEARSEEGILIDNNINEEVNENVSNELSVINTLLDTIYLDSTTFPDDALRADLASRLGIQEGDEITEKLIQDTKKLTFSNYSISNCEGLQVFTELTYLSLSNTKLTSIEPLGSLVNLTELYLGKGGEGETYRISDISCLSGLTKLTKLGLASNSVSDISVLENFPNLVWLNLQDNKVVEDISVLSNFTYFEYLNLGNNNISDFSPLKDLNINGSLYLYYNPADATQYQYLPRNENFEYSYTLYSEKGIDLTQYAPINFKFYTDNTYTTEVSTWTNNNSTVKYIVSYVKTLNIASLDVSAIEVTKVYDGTTSAAISSGSANFVFSDGSVISTTISSSDFTVSDFEDANVGEGKKITLTYDESKIPSSANYVLDNNVVEITGSITKAPLTFTANVANKEYDGKTEATVSEVTFTGVASGEELELNVDYTVTASFENANAGDSKNVTVKVTLLDTDKTKNYSLESDEVIVTANIEKISLDFTATVTNKIFDNTTVAEVTGFTITGELEGYYLTENVDYIVTATFEDENVGDNKKVTVKVELTSTDMAGNYTFTETSKDYTANITPKELNYTVAINDKTYDGNTEATVASVTFTDSSNEIVEGLTSETDYTVTAVFADANAGDNKTVNIVFTSMNSNYTFTGDSETTATINKAEISYTATASNKDYDGKTEATATVTFTGLVNEESLVETTDYTVTAVFADANAEDNKTVTVTVDLTGTGTSANYTLSSASETTTASINKVQISYTATANNKDYDGKTEATATVTFTGLVNGESLAETTDYTVTAVFADANAEDNKTVTVTVDLTEGSNYELSNAETTTTATINKAQISYEATASNKVYDGKTEATATVTFIGLVNGENLTETTDYTVSASFSDENVGDSKPVTVTVSLTGTGTSANYTLSSASETTTASITAKTITPTVTASNKVYDGNNSVIVSVSFDDSNFGENYTVTATFDDVNVGTDKEVSYTITLDESSNYVFSNNSKTITGTVKANITAKTITPIVTANSKEYDGSNTAEVSVTFDGLVTGESLDLNTGYTVTATFDDTNVGTDKEVSYTITLGDSSNYVFENSSETSGTVQANITAKTISYTATVSNKVYDGQTNAEVDIQFTGLVGNEELVLNTDYTVTANFDTAEVGTGKTVNVVVSLVEGSEKASNYELTQTDSTATASITAEALYYTVVVEDKTYDGTTNAVIESITFTDSSGGAIELEENTDYTVTASFENANAGENKTVNIEFNPISNNYTFEQREATTASINKAQISYTATANNKDYDGKTEATATVTFTGLVNGETLTETTDYTVTGVFADVNAGDNKQVTVTVTLINENYELTEAVKETTANINKVTISYTATASDKVYDGSKTAEVNVTFDGLVNGETLTEITDYTVSASFSDENVGDSKPVTVTVSLTGTGTSANYTLSSGSETTTASITAKAITPTVTASNKEYDGTNSVTVSVSFDDENIGEDYTITATFDDANVGTDKDVSYTITLDESSNYVFSNNSKTITGTVKASITAKAITPIVTASNKEYDGSNTAEVSVTFDGLVTGESLDLNTGYTVTATFDDANVGTGKEVSYTITLGDSSNYVFENSSETTGTVQANITAKTISYTATASDKVYDGSNTAEVNVTFDGLVNGETLTEITDYTVSASFSDENVGDSKPVTVTVSLTGTGTSANYTLSSGSETTTASITAEGLSYIVEVADKTYDGTTEAKVTSITFTDSNDNIIELEENTDYTVTASFADANAEENKQVSIELNSRNYKFIQIEETTATIEKAPISYRVIAEDKEYDGTTEAKVTVTFEGLAGEESLIEGEDYEVTAIFIEGEDVGERKTVNVRVSLIGTGTGTNYTLSSESETTTASITAKEVNYIVEVADKTYDGTTEAKITSITFTDVEGKEVTNLIEGIDYTVTASFIDENAEENKVVNVEFTSMNRNYKFTEIEETIGSINKAEISYTAKVEDKKYDGNTEGKATVTFEGLVEGERLIEGEDYEVIASFTDASVGKDKVVNVTVTLNSGSVIASNYTLASESITTTGNILKKEEETTGGEGVVIFSENSVEEEEEEKVFKDVENHWSKEYVYDLYEKGIVSGYTDGTFKPNVSTTRGDIAVLVSKLLSYLGVEEETEEVASYTDVEESKYYYSAIQELKGLGIMSGYTDGTFKPEDTITREEFVMVIYKVITGGYVEVETGEGKEFTDEREVSSWCKEAFKYVNETGIISGYTDGSFNPKGEITRAEIVTILYKILN